MKRIVIKSICVCSILLFCLTGCRKQEEKNIQDKLRTELEYVEDLIFKIANKHAKGEYIEEDEFKWNYVKSDVQRMNETWGTLVLDLTQVNVPNEQILKFSNDLNELLISFSKEDEKTLLEKLNAMYANVIVFKEAALKDKNQIEKNKIKGEVLSIYSLVLNQDFATAKTKSETLIETYKGLMNQISYAQDNGYNLNKVYVLLEEYRNAIGTGNKDLVRMKYIATVENL